MKLSLILFSLLFSFMTSAEVPKTHLLVFGGSGDSAGDTTIFDNGLKDLSNYYKSKQLNGELGETSISFDGGHKLTDEIRTTNFPKSKTNQTFTQVNYLKEIEHFKKMIRNNSVIKPGEQLLIYINSHGSEKSKSDLSHSIVTGDSTTQKVSLDQLAELKNLAAQNGVKLGIVDLSCHSGNTQNLADNNTCVISATGANHYAYAGRGFNGQFTGNIERGKNLESVFLQTRDIGTTADFPMISTPEGQSITNEIYKLLTPYLHFRNQPLQRDGSISDKISAEVLTTATDPHYQCLKNNSFTSLNNLLNDLEKQTMAIRRTFIFLRPVSLLNFQELRKSLKQYKEIQDSLARKLQSMHVENLNKIVKIDNANHYSWQNLLNTDWEIRVKYSTYHLLNDKMLTPGEKKQYELNIKIFTAANTAKKKIQNENPGLEKYKDVISDFEKGNNITLKLAEKIASFEKKIYTALYKNRMQETKKSNPCRDFKF